MARREARVMTSIWDDADFVGLSAGAQRLYVLILSHMRLTFCGVIDYQPKKWVRLARDTTLRTVVANVRELCAARFLVLDESTDEVWVRTFLKHDGVLESPNLVVAMARDWEKVLSPIIREGIVEGFPQPFLEGLYPKVSPQRLPQGFREAVAKRLANPVFRTLEPGVIKSSSESGNSAREALTDDDDESEKLRQAEARARAEERLRARLEPGVVADQGPVLDQAAWLQRAVANELAAPSPEPKPQARRGRPPDPLEPTVAAQLARADRARAEAEALRAEPERWADGLRNIRALREASG